jgi:exosortase
MSAAGSWKFIDGVLLSVLVGLAVAATWGPWADIAGIALRSDEQSHILLGVPIALWLGWVRRDRLRYCPPKWSLLGPLAVAVGWGLAWFGFRSGTDLAWHLGAVAVVFGAILTIVGVDFVIKFLPAFGALAFLLPVPGRIRQRIAIPLQEASAKVAEFGLDLFGLPVERAGNVLRLNGQDVAIAEACNGMRMVAALGLVAFAFVFTVPMRLSVRLLILAISPLVALLVNIVRLIPTTLLYGYSSVESAELFHDASGWGVLFLALGILWCVLAVLRWLEVPIAPYAVAED